VLNLRPALQPAYMHGDSTIVELEEGISKCVKAVVEMAYAKVTSAN